MSNSLSDRLPAGVVVTAPLTPRQSEVLTPEAIAFAARLHRAIADRRKGLLASRIEVQARIDEGWNPGFLAETQSVRDGNWRVGPIPADLQDRRVEITGPVERKMMINALNSGAKVFMADFEDANAPSWQNVAEGQVNLRDAVNRTISLTTPEGKEYRLNPTTATLLVRPRGWHLPERHVIVDGEPIAGGVFDFAVYTWTNAKSLVSRGSGPYFYLPKLEHHLEARLWNDLFLMAEHELDLPVGTIKATVLIETILAPFQMDEILWELKEHAAGLNAGRWDYMFSVIKKFGRRPGFVLPDRVQVGMTVPFMRAYTELLVQTCHRRGAHAIGGMAAFIPSRKDADINRLAIDKVTEDKLRESRDGFDGTWVAHPDLVPVAKAVFDAVLGDRPHQKDRMREDVHVQAAQLLDFHVPGGTITEAGLRQNINVGIQYVESWLMGVGAAAIHNLMEDAATAEISRSQVWQWVNTPGTRLADGREVTLPLVRALVAEELQKVRAQLGDARYDGGRFDVATRLFDELVSSAEFTDFLTLKAYGHLD
jgi:malate synthase